MEIIAFVEEYRKFSIIRVETIIQLIDRKG